MMIPFGLVVWAIAIAIVLLIVGSAVRVLYEYERGVVFRLGRFDGVRGRGCGLSSR